MRTKILGKMVTIELPRGWQARIQSTSYNDIKDLVFTCQGSPVRYSVYFHRDPKHVSYVEGEGRQLQIGEERDGIPIILRIGNKPDERLGLSVSANVHVALTTLILEVDPEPRLIVSTPNGPGSW